jgi:3-phosphoshikimate 1-carboxyvinyltransferase
MNKKFDKIKKVEGELSLPGDKSVSHRSVMFAALAKGKSKIYNLSNGEDVKSTMSCFEQMGIKIDNLNSHFEITGNGFKGLEKPDKELYAGNSGTTARLMSGILSAQNFESILTGDESLSQRDMKRIIDPLSKMGAKVVSENSKLPLRIIAAKKIIPIEYELPVSSAQVKSAVLLAGLHSEDTTTVIEKIPSRNHTEKMLGLKTEIKNNLIYSYVSKKNYPENNEYYIPSDISTAAFFIVLTLISKNSNLKIKNILLNKSRTGILEVLQKMGAVIKFENLHKSNNEEVGDIIIQSSDLKNISIDDKIIPNIIDEIPILSVASVFAGGEFLIKNVGELRHKESDRIKAICFNMKKLGLKVEEFEDGFSISGEITNKSPNFESYGDHRIAMSFAVLSLSLRNGGNVDNFDCVNISNPNFLDQLKTIIRN